MVESHPFLDLGLCPSLDFRGDCGLDGLVCQCQGRYVVREAQGGDNVGDQVKGEDEVAKGAQNDCLVT